MTYQTDCTLPEELLEQIAQEGLDELPELIRTIINAAMQIERYGTPPAHLKYPLPIVMVVLALLSHGCPLAVIVFAFGIDERTVVSWQMKAGDHAKRVQYQYVCRNTIQLAEVQADELWVKLQGHTAWKPSVEIKDRFVHEQTSYWKTPSKRFVRGWVFQNQLCMLIGRKDKRKFDVCVERSDLCP